MVNAAPPSTQPPPPPTDRDGADDAAAPSPARASTWQRWKRSPAVRWAGFLAAMALLAASVWYAIDQGDFRPLLRADPLWLIALAITTLLSAVVINAVLFWLVHRPYCDPNRPVSLTRMTALLAGSALLNYTPIKAGLVGRIAFLKHRHGISYGALVLIHVMITGAMVSSWAITILATWWRGGFDWLWALAAVLGIVLLALIGAELVRRVLPRRVDNPEQARAATRHSFSWTTMHLGLWIAVALANVLMVGIRWWIVFRIMDQPVGPDDAALMSVVHNAVTPMPANGMGLREWLIGLLFGGEAPAAFVTVSVVDRAAEAAIIIALGLASLWWLKRQGWTTAR